MTDFARLRAGVEDLLQTTGARIIMPRFRALAAADIEEKSPGELVTVADRESEAILAAGLAALLPAARVVGEEGASANPALLSKLDEGLVWIVDPIDGTSNFAAGRAPFGVIVALAKDGVTQAAWIYDPLTGRMCHAALGGGATIDGARLAPPVVPGRPIAALATQFMRPALRDMLLAQAETAFDLVAIPRCAAEHYPRVALGQNHVAVFQRTLPWDHAAGALFLSEAGGGVVRWDGSAYGFADGGIGIVAASSPALADHAREVLSLDRISAETLLPQSLDRVTPAPR